MTHSLDLIKNSRNLKTRLARCDFLLTCADRLQEYHDKGCAPPAADPRRIRQLVPSLRDVAIAGEIEQVCYKAQQAANAAATRRRSLATVARAEVRVQALASRLTDPKRAAPILARIAAEHDKLLHAERFEKAWHREAEGDRPAALAGYEAALQALRSDRTPDEQQQDAIEVLRLRIEHVRSVLHSRP